jgi:hypothetical protein
MKGKLLFTALIALVLFNSCDSDIYVNDYNNQLSGGEILESHDLWYIDFNRTVGMGEVPFLSKAFTISFRNGRMIANNNLVGLGYTGNGLGIAIGHYDYNYQSNYINSYHVLDGYYEFEVIPISNNSIKIYIPTINTVYFLKGYDSYSFDYNQVFYDNVHYFLQEYQAWEKVATFGGNANVFDDENYLTFIPDATGDYFKSSQDSFGTNIAYIYWDYIGNYEIYNTSTTTSKDLRLIYDIGANEEFDLSIPDDAHIELYHIASGTTYRFKGVGFIQYMRQEATRTKKVLKTLPENEAFKS